MIWQSHISNIRRILAVKWAYAVQKGGRLLEEAESYEKWVREQERYDPE